MSSGRRHVQTSQLTKMPSEAFYQNQASSQPIYRKGPRFFGSRITVEGCEIRAAQILSSKEVCNTLGPDSLFLSIPLLAFPLFNLVR